MTNHTWKADEAFYAPLQSFWTDEVSAPFCFATCGAINALVTFTYKKSTMPQPCSQQAKPDGHTLVLLLKTPER